MEDFKNSNKHKIAIIICIAIIAIIVISVVLILGNSNTGNNVTGNETSNNEQNVQEEEKKQEAKCVTIYDKIGVGTEVKFDGTLYNKNGESFSINDIDVIGELFNGSKFLHDYYLTTDVQAWKDSYPNWHTSKYIEKVVETIGKPTTIFQRYTEGDQGYTGSFYLIWDNGENQLILIGNDYTNWVDYNYTDLMCTHFINLDKIEDVYKFDLEKVKNTYEMYGKDVVMQ